MSNNSNLSLDSNHEINNNKAGDIKPDKENNSLNEKEYNNQEIKASILNQKVLNPIWLSISESAKLGGVTTKTIRRAVQSKKISYKIISNRYLIEFSSLAVYLWHNTRKLKNKFNQNGLGQYVKKWKK